MTTSRYNPATDKTVLKINGEYYTIIREQAFAFYLYTTREGHEDEMVCYRTKRQAIKRARALDAAKRTAERDAFIAEMRDFLDQQRVRLDSLTA